MKNKLICSGFIGFILTFFSLSSFSSDKVILVSFDGFMNAYLQKYLQNEFKNEGLGQILKEGTVANGMKVSLPSLTATSHLSIITGMHPGTHGIVSNLFNKITNSLDSSSKPANGFTTQWDPKAKTLWEIAKSKGKKIGIICYPGSDGKTEIRSGDWGMPYVESDYSSFIVELAKTNFSEYPRSLPDELKSFSLVLTADLVLFENIKSPEDPTVINHHGPKNPKAPPAVAKHTFKVLALDSTDDGVTNYDSLIFDDDDNISNGFMGETPTSVSKNPWVGLRFMTGDILKGSWSKLLSITSDLSKVKIYVGALHSTKAYPESFKHTIYKEVGFWPGAPDRSNENVSEEMVLEQAIRFSDFFKDVTRVAAQTQKWDVILSYQPILDELEHSFYMIDPRQANYSKEKSDLYLNVIERGYLHANRVIDHWMKSIPDTNFVFVSDHGMEPIHHEFFPNRVLKQNGLVEGTLKARSYSSGGLAHIYINLAGRNENGTVPQSQYEQLRQQIIDLYKNSEAIQNVYKREETEKLGLNHTDSGDVILVANPGYHLNNDNGSGEFLEPSSFYGQHGYDPSLPSMKAIFSAWGPKVKKEGLIPEINFTEVLPYTLRLMNVSQ